jgi:hypothetical protein
MRDYTPSILHVKALRKISDSKNSFCVLLKKRYVLMTYLFLASIHALYRHCSPQSNRLEFIPARVRRPQTLVQNIPASYRTTQTFSTFPLYVPLVVPIVVTELYLSWYRISAEESNPGVIERKVPFRDHQMQDSLLLINPKNQGQ